MRQALRASHATGSLGALRLWSLAGSGPQRGAEHPETGGTRPLERNVAGCGERAPRSHRALARVECHLWHLASQRSFAGDTLQRAMQATFRARLTPLPRVTPVALTEEIARDPLRQRMWRAFLNRSRLPGPTELESVVPVLSAFLLPPVQHAEMFAGRWAPGGPWRLATPRHGTPER